MFTAPFQFLIKILHKKGRKGTLEIPHLFSQLQLNTLSNFLAFLSSTIYDTYQTRNLTHILTQFYLQVFSVSSSDIEHTFQSTDLAIIAFQVCIMFIKFQYAIIVFQLLSLNLLSEKQVCYLFLMGKDLVSSW